jgi:hypothetical protein
MKKLNVRKVSRSISPLLLPTIVIAALLQVPTAAFAIPSRCTLITSVTLAGGEGGHVIANNSLTASLTGTTPVSCAPNTPTYKWTYSSTSNMASPITLANTSASFTPTGGTPNLVGKYVRLTFSYKPNATTTTLESTPTLVWPADVVIPAMDPEIPVTYTYEGNIVTAVGNRVEGFPAPVESYRWWSCTDNSDELFNSLRTTLSTVTVGADTCSVVTGATTSSYTVTGVETGRYFYPEVTETNDYGTVSAYGISLPEVTSPTFTGTSWEGQTLTRGSTSATGYPTPSIAYAWQTTSDGTTWTTVGSGETYTVKAADRSYAAQKQIRLTATATSGSQSDAKSSDASNTYTAPNATGGSVIVGGGNFTAPVSFKVGQTVYGHPWSVMGTPWPTLTFQWYICETAAAAATPVASCVTSGSTGTSDHSTNYDFSFVVPSDAAGKYLTFTASLENSATTFNLTQSRIMPSRVIYSVLALTTSPVISGTKVVGQPLSVSAPTTTSLPAPQIAYQWLSSDTADGTYTPLVGATRNTFKLLDAQRGRFIKVTATATLPMNDSVTVTSAATEVILGNQATVTINNSNASRGGPAGTPITVIVAGGTGGGTVTISSVTSGCTVDQSTLTIARATSTGTCAVVATKAANGSYLSASSASATFTFNGATQSPALSISNTPFANLNKGTTNVNLTTSGGAGDGVVTYALAPASVCSLIAGVLTVSTSTNSGSAVNCAVTATKAASGIYKVATATKTFTFKG